MDWLNGTKLRRIAQQLTIDRELLASLKTWKQSAQFAAPADWMFASPAQRGRLPWSYDQVWRAYQKAAEAVGIGGLGTYSLRHTYRSWLDSVGTPIGVQQKRMRHTDIRTTMRYGDAFTSDMAQAHRKVVGLALSGMGTACPS